MFAISVLVTVIGLLSAALAYLDPNGDRARVAAARRQLRNEGIGYRKGSPEEARALRVILEGDAPQGV